jgi:hypothetical protein
VTPDPTPTALPAPRRRRRTVPPKRKLQSLAQLDKRTGLARAARDLQAAIIADLGGDLSAAQTVLVTRAALLDAFCGACEAAWLTGAGAMDPSYAGCVSQLRRTLESLGLRRVARVVENPIVAEFNRKEAIRLAQYANMPEPDYSVTDFALTTKEGPQP